MRNLLLIICCCIPSLFLAQNAPDFSVTTSDGDAIALYSDWLDQDKKNVCVQQYARNRGSRYFGNENCQYKNRKTVHLKISCLIFWSKKLLAWTKIVCIFFPDPDVLKEWLATRLRCVMVNLWAKQIVFVSVQSRI